VKNFDADLVKVDNVYGAYLAMRHLITTGYKRIGIIAGTQYLSPGRERLQGCKDALAEFGIPVEDTLIEIGNFKLESGYELTKKLMQDDNPPDVIFAANNLMTMGAMRALHDLGVSIPEQVALIGFDDMPWAQDLNPALTAVSQPGYELGSQAVQLLLKRIEHPESAYQKVTLQPRLIVRQSCGAQVKKPNFSQ
jgi:DNA-binding LacI/PurR family transcriptional regulator